MNPIISLGCYAKTALTIFNHSIYSKLYGIFKIYVQHYYVRLQMIISQLAKFF